MEQRDIYCIFCGAKNKDDDQFCGKCGARLNGSTIVDNDQIEDTQPKKKNVEKGSFLIGILALLWPLLGFIFAIYFRAKKDRTDKDFANSKIAVRMAIIGILINFILVILVTVLSKGQINLL